MTFSIIICDKYDLSLFPSFTKKAQFGVIWQKKVFNISFYIFCKEKKIILLQVYNHPVEIKDK